MILQALRDLAVREQLVEDPSYENGKVSFAIVLKQSGAFVQLMDLRGEGRKKKEPQVMPIPRRMGRTGNDQEDFLVDKSEYVLGVEPDGKRSAEKLAIRAGLFLRSVEAAAKGSGSGEVEALAAFLRSAESRAQCAEAAAAFGYKSNDMFCFEVGGTYVHDLPAVKEYWRNLRRSGRNVEGRTCVVCGETSAPVDKHMMVQLGGGSSSGVALVSFNASAFESYGWERNENAAFCRKCADGYATALRRCLVEYPSPLDPDLTLPRQSTLLSEDLTAVYWADTEAAELIGAVGKLNYFTEDDASLLKAQFQAPWTGKQAGRTEGNFYCLFLQGGQGRATVRGWHTEKTQDVHNHIVKWFAETDVGDDRPKPLSWLLNSLAVKREGRKLPERFIRALYGAALFGVDVPLGVLVAAVTRNRVEKTVTAERAALLQVYLIRKTKERKYMALQEGGSTAYRLGRLLAVLQRQQARVNRNLNKNITDRFYTALSTRPASVFPGLMSLGRTHTAGLGKEGRYFEEEIAGLLDGVFPVPATLGMQEQGEFALGFYHQRHHDISAAKAYKNEEKGVEEDVA